MPEHKHLDDARWEGQDSQSLPDRPAHPDPSKRAEFGDPEKTPSHGIYGHLEAKHGLVSDKDLDADTTTVSDKVAKDIVDGKLVPSAESNKTDPSRAGKRDDGIAMNAPKP